MKLDFHADRPIYLQLAEAIENEILKGTLGGEDEQVPSTTEISVKAKINPATALKGGMNLLVDEGILYKRRGVGLFVKAGARQKIFVKRKAQFYELFVATLLEEAKKLDISREELIAMIERGCIQWGKLEILGLTKNTVKRWL